MLSTQEIKMLSLSDAPKEGDWRNKQWQNKRLIWTHQYKKS